MIVIVLIRYVSVHFNWHKLALGQGTAGLVREWFVHRLRNLFMCDQLAATCHAAVFDKFGLLSQELIFIPLFYHIVYRLVLMLS